MKKRKHISTFDIINTILVILITLVVTYPLYFCVIASVSNPTEVTQGNTLLWVKGFDLFGYRQILKESQVWIGYRNTIFYTVLGTLYNLVLTIPTAFVLSKKQMHFHTVLSWYFFLTMYISGGMVPTYMLIKNLKLIDTPWVLIIGAGVSCYNLIITRQYFSSSIPQEIYEAASIDGAGHGKCFVRIALPLAKPILAVMTLYYGVGHWNSYMNALLYIHKKDLYPLQLVLRNVLINSQLNFSDLEYSTLEEMEFALYKAQLAQSMKYGIVIVASLPLIMIYPFIQKYFEKGIMIGSVKG